jgi:hypothetical protein
LGDVLTRFAKGEAELLILPNRMGQLAFGLEKTLLQRAHALGGIEKLAAKRDHFFFEGLALFTKLGQLF